MNTSGILSLALALTLFVPYTDAAKISARQKCYRATAVGLVTAGLIYALFYKTSLDYILDKTVENIEGTLLTAHYFDAGDNQWGIPCNLDPNVYKVCAQNAVNKFAHKGISSCNKLVLFILTTTDSDILESLHPKWKDVMVARARHRDKMLNQVILKITGVCGVVAGLLTYLGMSVIGR